ncbi:MAG: rRNA maturation RNase YbeY [Gammaproteobacteria bacterium]|nr:rRNA maturation RNase YbeY [Gammaproteobacteria bacterium]MCW8987242.1 rRNA maturation RNase YbeY [Gammaproteobacteria bacterium]MCW9030955.1 rRNA maturation RNase YbeY [Gammaproteobacteria bacterium]
MEIYLDVQREVEALPTDDEILKWVSEVLISEQHADTELTVRFVSEEESAELNEQYRHKTGATNVLSFPFEAPAEVELNLLGDLVICSDVVKKQAKEQQKQELAHWAHMIVHGMLHLLGYDHQTDAEANIMETKEIHILSQLGYSDPYREINV